MAKKTRKTSAVKPKKKSKSVRKKSALKKTKVKAKAKTKRKTKAAKSKSIGNRLAGAYRAVIDTVKETDALRNKLEQPGTSETE